MGGYPERASFILAGVYRARAFDCSFANLEVTRNRLLTPRGLDGIRGRGGEQVDFLQAQVAICVFKFVWAHTVQEQQAEFLGMCFDVGERQFVRPSHIYLSIYFRLQRISHLLLFLVCYE